MTANSYPSLGFDPAPGSVSVVSELTARLQKSAQTISDAHKMIENLRSGGDWEGDAAVAFREQLDGALPTNLKNAHSSITRAATALADWQKALDGHQQRARALDSDAKDAKTKIGTAEGQEKTASANPDLKLAGKTRPAMWRSPSAISSPIRSLPRARGWWRPSSRSSNWSLGSSGKLPGAARPGQGPHFGDAA